MNYTNANISIKQSLKNEAENTSGTITEVEVSKIEVLHNPKKHALSVDGVSELLNNLSIVQESHRDSKSTFFSKGLPFYTCINAIDNLWLKEMPDNSVYHVSISYDWEKNCPIEKQLKRIR